MVAVEGIALEETAVVVDFLVGETAGRMDMEGTVEDFLMEEADGRQEAEVEDSQEETMLVTGKKLRD